MGYSYINNNKVLCKCGYIISKSIFEKHLFSKKHFNIMVEKYLNIINSNNNICHDN